MSAFVVPPWTLDEARETFISFKLEGELVGRPPATVPRNAEGDTFIDVRKGGTQAGGSRWFVRLRWEYDDPETVTEERETETSRRDDFTLGDARRKALDRAQSFMDEFAPEDDTIDVLTTSEGEDLQAGDAVEVAFFNTIAGREDTHQAVIEAIRSAGDQAVIELSTGWTVRRGPGAGDRAPGVFDDNGRRRGGINRPGLGIEKLFGDDKDLLDARSLADLWIRENEFGFPVLRVEWADDAPILQADPAAIEAIEGRVVEQAQGVARPVDEIDVGTRIGEARVVADILREGDDVLLENARLTDVFILEAYEREEPEAEAERDEDDNGQVGLNAVAEEVGVTEELERPGESIAAAAIERFEETGGTPTEVNGWVEAEATGNYGLFAWRNEGGDGPLKVQVDVPIRQSGHRVGLDDDRISGFGSNTDIVTGEPPPERRYETEAEAVTAAIRWMARHPADRTQHPFFDERIHDPPEGWENARHNISQRQEKIWFQPGRGESIEGVVQIQIEGFHRGDRYTVRSAPPGRETIGSVPRLNQADPGGNYPEPDQEVPRDRALDAATRFMERNQPEF